MKIKDILRERKGDKSWSQLAKELGISRQTIHNALNERYWPSSKLIKALGLNADYSEKD